MEADGHEPTTVEVERRVRKLVNAVAGLSGHVVDADALASDACAEVEAALALPTLEPARPATARVRSAAKYWRILPDDVVTMGTLLVVALVRPFAVAAAGSGAGPSGWLDEWTLRDVISGSLMGIGFEYQQAQLATSLVGILASGQLTKLDARSGFAKLADLLETDEGRRFVYANWHGGVLWYNRESLVELRWWLGEEAILAASLASASTGKASDLGRTLVSWRAFSGIVDRCMGASEFHLDLLLESLRGLATEAPPVAPVAASEAPPKGSERESGRASG